MKRLLWIVLLFVPAIASAQAHQNRADVVEKVKAQVKAAGIDINHGPGECGRFEITARVAWELRGEGLGLLGGKSGGQNGCGKDFKTSTGNDRYAVDAVIYQDGYWCDILDGNAADGNGPVWHCSQGTSAAAWRAPFEPPALGTPNNPPPPDNPPPVVACDLTPLMNAVNALDVKVVALDVKVEDLRTNVVQAKSFLKDWKQWLPVVLAMIGGAGIGVAAK